jgi:peptidoglycan/xylan/chitin deacetylase (PgdA/CDA1 family)
MTPTLAMPATRSRRTQRTARPSRTATRVISLVIAVAWWSVTRIHEAVSRLSGGTPRTTPLVVLTYHAVTQNDCGRFERQMLSLKRHATPVLPDAAPVAADRPVAAVTFDDALQCVFDHALPVLERHGIPATVFVPTGYLCGPAAWMPVGNGADNGAGRVAARAALAALDPGRVKLGSHSVTHRRLPLLEATAIREELAVSRQTLEEITGAPVTMFALPYGACSAAVLAAAREAGYEQVFANVPVSVGPELQPRLVGRIDVSPRDWPLEFRLKAAGAYQWLTLAIPAKRALLRWLGRAHTS